MLFGIVADAVVLVHFGFILFVATGPLLAWRWPALAWAHPPALAWAVASLTVGFPCPLTGVEKTLRRWAGTEPYDGGFVDHYLEDAIYPGSYSSALRLLAAVAVVAGYAGLHRRALRRESDPTSAAGRRRPPPSLA